VTVWWGIQEAPSKLHENKELNSARRKKEAERLNTLVDKMQVRGSLSLRSNTIWPINIFN
jgi:hypothetical protein